MGVESETLAREIKMLFDDELPAALDTVEAEWAAIEAIVLPDPVTVFIGHKPTILEEPSTSFPFVAIIIPDREPEEGSEWGFQKVAYDALIDYFVVAATEATVNLMALRYAQAIVNVLQAHSAIGGYAQKNHEPPLTLSEASRHLTGGTTGDAFDTGDVDYIQMGRITVRLS